VYPAALREVSLSGMQLVAGAALRLLLQLPLLLQECLSSVQLPSGVEKKRLQTTLWRSG